MTIPDWQHWAQNVVRTPDTQCVQMCVLNEEHLKLWEVPIW